MKFENSIIVYLIGFSAILIVCYCDNKNILTAGDSYTEDELKLLPKYYKLVKPYLTQTYMHEKKYLIRYLRAQHYNLKAAEEMMKQNIQWRDENEIESLREKDWSWWKKNYPFTYIRDKVGRPGIQTGLRGLSLRKALITGKRDELRLYVIAGLEEALEDCRAASNSSGIEFINGYLLFNLAGYTNRDFACLSCVPSLVEIVTTYENYYPLTAYRIIAINVPRVFEGIYQALAPVLTQHTKKALWIFGFNKAEFQSEMLKIFDEDLLLTEFGGKVPLIR